MSTRRRENEGNNMATLQFKPRMVSSEDLLPGSRRLTTREGVGQLSFGVVFGFIVQ